MQSVFIIIFLIAISLSKGQQCEPYTGQLCKDYIQFPIYVRTPQQLTEFGIVAAGVVNLTAIAHNVDPECEIAAKEYVCSTYFPTCVRTQNETLLAPLLPCQSICTTFHEKCTSLLRSLNRTSLLTSCEISSTTLQPYPTANCHPNVLPMVFPQDFECPAPMLPIDPRTDLSNPGTRCFGKCCLPCPYTHYLYPEGMMRKIDDVVISFSIISFSLCAFVVVTFVMIKQKRAYPSILITYIAASLCCFYLVAFFSVGNPQRVRCITPVDPSSPGFNENGLCQTQSIFVVFGVLSASFWYFTLVMNIHLVVVWSIRDMDRFFWIMNILFWGIPVLMLIIYNSAQKAGYSVGVWCIMERGGYLNGTFMIPLAILIFSSFLVNIATLTKIFIVARDRNAKISHIIRLQIRPFFFVFTVVLIFMFYWLYFEVNLQTFGNVSSSWTSEWATCILLGNGQNPCSEISLPNLPNVPLFAFSEALVHLIGFVVFGFFAMREETFNFWISIFTGREFSISEYYGSNASKSNLDVNSAGATAREEQMSKMSSRKDLISEAD